jgi:hypothetical protein
VESNLRYQRGRGQMRVGRDKGGHVIGHRQIQAAWWNFFAV